MQPRVTRPPNCPIYFVFIYLSPPKYYHFCSFWLLIISLVFIETLVNLNVYINPHKPLLKQQTLMKTWVIYLSSPPGS